MLICSLIPTETRILRLDKVSGRLRTFRTAVSLHSHTHHSRENLGFLPYYVNRIPVIADLVRSKLKDHEKRYGKPIDFKRGYWMPPASPGMLLASEIEQIERCLGLASLVSITDHDSIAAGLSLQQQPTTVPVPISVEWTIPFASNFFHVGVHSLPPDRAPQIMRELEQYTAEPNEERLGNLLSFLESWPETLLVLNHPCSDFVKVGRAIHNASLEEFVRRWRPWIHAFELNGMRPWPENDAVIHMAEALDLPVVAGGDRHGLRPNTVLNLSPAESWGEFVEEVRKYRRSEIVVLPSYEEPVKLRELATASDALRHYPDHREGRCRFTDRVFIDVWDRGMQPLSFYWAEDNARQPRWLSPATRVLMALGSNPVRPVLRRLLSLRGEYDDVNWTPAGEYRHDALIANTSSAK